MAVPHQELCSSSGQALCASDVGETACAVSTCGSIPGKDAAKLPLAPGFPRPEGRGMVKIFAAKIFIQAFETSSLLYYNILT